MHAPDGPADVVFVGGRVMTMDADRSVAEAIAVRDGRLVAIGTAAEVERLAGPRTRRVDLTGRTLLPGFQDAHVHPSMAGVGLLRCPLHDLPADAAGYLDAIATYAAALP
ncbi:MAG TPA: amidohydrolase family protein, partial [Candidatus Sulfotelmatobacter sp.]|nr:amidohydrolase family protein [Candidatus Sulfotelmatobacter sp.]